MCFPKVIIITSLHQNLQYHFVIYRPQFNSLLVVLHPRLLLDNEELSNLVWSNTLIPDTTLSTRLIYTIIRTKYLALIYIKSTQSNHIVLNLHNKTSKMESNKQVLIFTAVVAHVLIFLAKCGYTLDMEGAKEQPCFKIDKTVPMDLDWVLI